MGKVGVLLVDDEALALKYFTRAFAHRFPVYSAASAEEALLVLEMCHAKIGVIVTDQRMPEASGIDLLKIVRKRYPRTVRILTTAYSELDLLIEAINTGAVYSFVSKPWQLPDLEAMLLSALERHETEVSNHESLEKKLDELRQTILENRTYDVALIAAKIGHYVHNALCPVTLLIDQLLDQRDGGPHLSHDFLKNVNAHIQEIASTLKDLAQISVPPGRHEFRTLDLPDLLARAIANTEILRREKNLRIETSVEADIPPIAGVPAQIEKLFRFMIAEEVVSLPADSCVRITLRSHVADGEHLGVQIEFEDFEPVAPGAVTENLLHPFNLRGANPREFGVFLASSYFIARHHEGSLTARVKEDHGLVFTFFLPGSPLESVDSALGGGSSRSAIE